MPDIPIKTERPFVDELLGRYETLIGGDLPGYRNHVYRAITYAMHFLGHTDEHERLVGPPERERSSPLSQASAFTAMLPDQAAERLL